MAATHTLNILIVHGIGWGDRGKGYARPLEDNIRREFDRAIEKLSLRDADRRDAHAKHALRFEAVCWDPVTQVPQDALAQVMFGKPGPFSRFNVTYRLRRNMIGLLGDVTSYESSPTNKVYQAIHAEVDRCAKALSEASVKTLAEGENAHLTVIGHSLGSVIASDYVWDHTRSTGHSHILGGHRLALKNVVTMGSPMALYALRNNAGGGIESIRESLDSPIKIEPDGGLWLNVYDEQDAIAFPLGKIDSYKAAGVIDCTVNAGNWLTRWNLASHTGYWNNDTVARLIARKLALDWAQLNDAAFAERDYAKAVRDLRDDMQEK